MLRLEYKVTYYDSFDDAVRVKLIKSKDYWDACRRAWNKIRKKEEDFQLSGPDVPERAPLKTLPAKRRPRTRAAT